MDKTRNLDNLLSILPTTSNNEVPTKNSSMNTSKDTIELPKRLCGLKSFSDYIPLFLNHELNLSLPKESKILSEILIVNNYKNLFFEVRCIWMHVYKPTII